MKRILDSVHGQIEIPKKWCDLIIDTPFFQRLRRIEQNSCRAVFPSARHDRFIHSLGVYHIGTLIAKHIAEKCNIPNFDYDILMTYRLACLLHDVGHTPFSHTFEGFFNETLIKESLKEKLGDETFSADLNARQEKLTEHELISALVAVIVYRDKFADEPICWPLLVRMIIGLPFVNRDDQPDATRFENIMIELIHGTIDADGLDYVCRDVWAGGYHNFSVDFKRLIGAIQITESNGEFQLSFSAKALNEIESVLNIKNFQFLYVFNHHKVLLEQHYLIEAMKSTAAYYMEDDNRDEALRKLCDYTAFTSPVSLLKNDFILYQPCDDDFVALMRQMPNKELFINGWFGREFVHKPLWKSKIHFFHSLSDVLYSIPVPMNVQKGESADFYLKKVREKRIDAICEKPCKDYVIHKLNLSDEDVIQIKIKPKIRKIDPNRILVSLGGTVKSFAELAYDSFTVTSNMLPFCYWYVNLNHLPNDNDDAKLSLVVESIKEYVTQIV